MVKKYLLLVGILFCCNKLYSQNKSDLFSIGIAGPETHSASGLGDSLKLKFTSYIFRAEYTRLFKVTKRLKLGASINYHRGLVKVKYNMIDIPTLKDRSDDFESYGFGLNAFYKLKSFNKNKTLFAQFEFSYLRTTPLFGVFYSATKLNDSLYYESFISVDYNANLKKLNYTLSLNYCSGHKYFDYSVVLGITYISPFIRDAWFGFYRDNNGEKYETYEHIRFKFLHPQLEFSIGF